jgi:nucleotide-binding universal stress UspA family protein
MNLRHIVVATDESDAGRQAVAAASSYATWDLTVLGWDAALVVEPDPVDRDVEQLLEFANAQLLSCGSTTRDSAEDCVR